MKRLFILTTLLVTVSAFVPWNGSGQNNGNKTVNYNDAAQKPSFQGGDINDFSKWVKAHLVYPESAKKNNVEGMVYLSFTVYLDGSVRDVKVTLGKDPDIDKEAARVVSSSPKWTPGKDSNGKPIRVSCTNFPVSFFHESVTLSQDFPEQIQSKLTEITARGQVALGDLLTLRDIEWDIIKKTSNPNITGLTACIDYYTRETYEEWGETKYKRELYKSEFLNKGLSILTVDWPFSNERISNPLAYLDPHAPSSAYAYSLRLCLYNIHGVLTEVRYYRAYFRDLEALDDATLFTLEHRELYEYDSSNRIKSITFKEYPLPKDAYSPDKMHICQKDYLKQQIGYVCRIIYKYLDNGQYEVFGCYWDGSTKFHNIINGNSAVDSDGHAWTLNDKGQILAYSYSSIAVNGVVQFDTYYKYNKNGDLVAKSSNSDVIKEDEPWLVEGYQYNNSTFYKYNYDSHNNWVLQEEIKCRYGNMEVVKTIERAIDYDRDYSLP